MTDPIPDRVLNFGSSEPREDEEGGITPETLDAHIDKLPRPTGYRVLILPFKTQATKADDGQRTPSHGCGVGCCTWS